MTRPAVFHPVLVAVYPVVFLYAQNVGTFPIASLFRPQKLKR